MTQQEAVIQAALKNPTPRNVKRLAALCRKLIAAQAYGRRKYNKLLDKKMEADRTITAHIWRQQVHRSPSR
jgi:hypothetical protein